ncbi:MAG: radical SAM protein [Bacteroidales bacterium]|nr:radical SAM protein [Bacteroidales bacterium]
MTKAHLDNIVFELTQACNQCCRFCYNYWRDGSTPLPAPDPALARKTLRTLLRQASVGTLSFSGGEPMLLKNVHDMALAARFKGTRVNILTNGTLLTPDAFENFRSIGIGAVQIPILSADPAVHEYLTGLKGSWHKATEALRLVASQMPSGAYAVLVITAVNAPGVTQTLGLIRSLGVRHVMVNRFNIGGMGLLHTKELVLNPKTLRQAFADVEAFGAEYPDMHFVSGVCTPLCIMDPTPFPHIRFSWCSTDFSRRPVTVAYNGDVRFCNHSPYVIGNIHQRTIGGILNDPETVARYSVIPEKCRDCSMLKRCNGGCRAASEQVYGTFGEADPIVSSLEN